MCGYEMHKVSVSVPFFLALPHEVLPVVRLFAEQLFRKGVKTDFYPFKQVHETMPCLCDGES